MLVERAQLLPTVQCRADQVTEGHTGAGDRPSKVVVHVEGAQVLVDPVVPRALSFPFIDAGKTSSLR